MFIYNGSLEVHAVRTHWQRSIGLHIINKPVEPNSPPIWKFLQQDIEDKEGLTYKFVEVGAGLHDPEPAVHLSLEAGQHLMDQLWQCGLRPTEGSGSAGAMAATQKHLEDMRKMVFEGFTFKEAKT